MSVRIAIRRQIERFLIFGLFFFFPLERLNVHVVGYPVSVSFLSFIALSLFIILCRPFRVHNKHFFLLTLFTACVFISAVLNDAYSSMLRLGILLLLVAPFVWRNPWAGAGDFAALWFIRGGVLSLFIASYQVLHGWFYLVPLETIIPLFDDYRTYNVGGFYRLASGFYEPAHYGIYLAFCFAVTDKVQGRLIPIGKGILLKYAFVIALIGTLSLAGFVVFMAYYLASFLTKIYRIKTLIIAVLCCVVFVVSFSLLPKQNKFVDYLTIRSKQTIQAISEGALTGSSAAVRVNSPLVFFDYYIKSDGMHRMFGEGLNNYDLWLKKEYMSFLGSPMERGTVQNVFVVVGLGTGVVGLAIYTLFAYSIVMRGADKFPLAVMWLLTHFAFGYLITYPLWGYALLVMWLGSSPEGPSQRQPLQPDRNNSQGQETRTQLVPAARL